jgi:hypothetical protein
MSVRPISSALKCVSYLKMTGLGEENIFMHIAKKRCVCVTHMQVIP